MLFLCLEALPLKTNNKLTNNKTNPILLSRIKEPIARLLLLLVITIELKHSTTIPENTAEIEPQPVVLDFKNLSQYSSRSK